MTLSIVICQRLHSNNVLHCFTRSLFQTPTIFLRQFGLILTSTSTNSLTSLCPAGKVIPAAILCQFRQGTINFWIWVNQVPTKERLSVSLVSFRSRSGNHLTCNLLSIVTYHWCCSCGKRTATNDGNSILQWFPTALLPYQVMKFL